MKITELKCKACGGSLKVDEENPNVAECEYCHTRYTLEGSQKSIRQQAPQFDYIPFTPPEKKKTGWEAYGWKRGAVLAAAFFVIVGVMFGPRVYQRYQMDKAADDETALSSPGYLGAEGGGEGAADSPMEKLKADPLMAAFCQSVFERPIEELTAEDLSGIRQLAFSSTTEMRKIGYSFSDPLEDPDAPLTWETFSRDTFSEPDLSCLPAFSGLAYISASQGLREGDLAGLSIQSISGYFGGLSEIAALVDEPESLIAVESMGSSAFDLSGIENFSGLKKLTIAGEPSDAKLLVQGKSIQSLALGSRELLMDFSVLGMMPELRELSLSSENLWDVGFVSKLPNLTSLSLSNGTMLTLDALRDCPALEALSIVNCDEIKDLSAVSALSSLKSLHLDLPYGCPEPDISNLSQIEELYIEGFQTMGFLRNMGALQVLTLDSCSVSDPSVFSGLGNLKSLTCTSFGTAERDYSFVPSLTSLEEVNLTGTSTYDDISGIFNLPALKRLYIGGMSAEIRFDNIQENTVLEDLDIDHMKLYKNVNVSGGGGIYYVDWDDVNLVENLDFLSRLKNLKHLSIQENELTDLSFAQNLGALESIDFSDNYITDVSPLSGLQNLKQVTGTDNPVSNYETLGSSVTVIR